MIAGGDVEQRVVREDEIRSSGADRRSQRRVDVELRGRLRRRGISPRSEQQRERESARRRTDAGALLAAVWLIGCATPPTPSLSPVASPPAQLDATTPLASNPFCPRIAHIVVRKSEHLLVAHCDPGPVIAMSVAIGRSPVGTKLTRGDQRTPEGNYRVSGPAHRSRFHLLIPIDYPSRRDADEALARGAITPREHARILARRSQDRPPPQDTALGGHLGLHGEGLDWQGESDGLDWTYGCIAMTDAEIEFLAQRVRSGTPVWIQP